MDERHDIVELARQVGGEGFDDMVPEELDALITSHAKELTEEKFLKRRRNYQGFLGGGGCRQ